MDEKLERMLEFRVWQELFPVFRDKGINPETLALLAQPEHRYRLVKKIENGEYHFGVPREVPLPKKGGGVRKIYILPDIDRCVMSVVSRVYMEMYGCRIHPSCKSYQRGLSVPATLHSIRKDLGTGGYKVDLSKYFDSVPRWKINELLESMDTGSPVDRALWEFYNTDRIIRNGKDTAHFKSLGQGCAFSPLLANLCLASVDAELDNLCTLYVRYSDDILMLGDRAEEALQKLRERLSGMELGLNPKKVLKIGENSEFIFLGGKVCRDWVRMSKQSWDEQKKAVKKIVRKYGKCGDRKAQQRVVKRLRRYFLKKNDGYCMMEYFCFLCTDEYDMKRLDEYCRDEIKAAYTGKHNHAANEHKTGNELIRNFGWVSLVHLYRLFKMNRCVFNARLAALQEPELHPSSVLHLDRVFLTPDVATNLASGLVKSYGQYYKVQRKERSGVFQRIEELWPMARLYWGFTALNVYPDKGRVYTLDESMEILYAVKEIELLIVTTEWSFDHFFWQSKVFPELVIFRDWCIDK